MGDQAKAPKGQLIKFFLPGFLLGLIVGGVAGVYVATAPPETPRVKAGKGPTSPTDRREERPADPEPESPTEGSPESPGEAPAEQPPGDAGSPAGGG